MDFFLLYWMDPPPSGPEMEGDIGRVTGDRFRTRGEAVDRARELFGDPRASYLALYGPSGLFLDTLRLAAEAGVQPPGDGRVLSRP